MAIITILFAQIPTKSKTCVSTINVKKKHFTARNYLAAHALRHILYVSL